MKPEGSMKVRSPGGWLDQVQAIDGSNQIGGRRTCHRFGSLVVVIDTAAHLIAVGIVADKHSLSVSIVSRGELSFHAMGHEKAPSTAKRST